MNELIADLEKQCAGWDAIASNFRAIEKIFEDANIQAGSTLACAQAHGFELCASFVRGVIKKHSANAAAHLRAAKENANE